MKKGATHTEYAKRAISKKMIGKPKSTETRERMSMARMVWWSKQRDKARKRKAANELEVRHNESTSISEVHVSMIEELQKPLGEA